MRRLLGVLLLVPFLSGLGGCSVAMALSSEKTPDLTVLTAGADRVEIEEALGEPIRVEPIAGTDEVIVTYEYTEGKKADPLRALAHGFFDALTLGLWELAGVPIEMAVSQQHRHEVVVVYDQGQRLASMVVPPQGWLREEDQMITIVGDEATEGFGD